MVECEGGLERSLGLAPDCSAEAALRALIGIRHGRHDLVPEVVERGQHAIDELNALRMTMR